jgi:hypothetical protein
VSSLLENKFKDGLSVERLNTNPNHYSSFENTQPLLKTDSDYQAKKFKYKYSREGIDNFAGTGRARLQEIVTANEKQINRNYNKK